MASHPDIIYIIRHGEKLGDPAKDTDTIIDLSVRGSARAAALPSLFESAHSQLSCALASDSSGYEAQYAQQSVSGPAQRFSKPDFLFATKPSKHSNRPVETITPLAAALQLPVSHDIADKDYKTLANTLQDSTYEGRIVLIAGTTARSPRSRASLALRNRPHGRRRSSIEFGRSLMTHPDLRFWISRNSSCSGMPRARLGERSWLSNREEGWNACRSCRQVLFMRPNIRIVGRCDPLPREIVAHDVDSIAKMDNRVARV